MKSRIVVRNEIELSEVYKDVLAQSLVNYQQSAWSLFWNQERRSRAKMISLLIGMILMWWLTFQNIILNLFAFHIVLNEYCTTIGYCTKSITYITCWWSYVFLVLPLIFQYIRINYAKVKCQFYILEWCSLMLVVGVLTTWEKLDQYYLRDDNYAVLFALVFSIFFVFDRYKEVLLIALFWALTLTNLYRSISFGFFWAYVFSRNIDLKNLMNSISFPSNFIIRQMKNQYQHGLQTLQEEHQIDADYISETLEEENEIANNNQNS